MSWNNIIPAELLLGTVQLTHREIDNPAVTIPDELLTDCPIQYSIEGLYATLSHVDHPAFAKLRSHLKNTGLIEIPEYPCWNGDRVLKSFRFNGLQLNPGETFYCAAAWRARFDVNNKKGM
jgi:hypothetical protein